MTARPRPLTRSFSFSLVAAVALAACGGDDGNDAAVDGPSSADGASGSGCGSGDVVADRPLSVAATVAPITDIVAIVADGSGTRVTGVVPEGTNSHTYEPTPGVAATLEDADVVFLNGLQLEEPTRELAESNLSDGAEICELGTTLLPEDAYLFDFSFPESAGAPNPHLWTNPPMVDDYAALIRDVLSTRDPANADVYAANYEDFAAAVGELDDAVRAASETIPDDERLLLTYHDAYAYFAEEYGWTVLGAVQPSSFDEPTPREVADLIEQVRETGVTAVFGSEVFPSPVLQQIADETGIEYVDDLRDDDLPGAPGDPDHSWFALMRFNYVTIVEALGGDASALKALELPAPTDGAEFPQ